jgi:hypothetical protein
MNSTITTMNLKFFTQITYQLVGLITWLVKIL